MATTIPVSELAQFMVDQVPVFDELIMKSIRPFDGWLTNIKYGTWHTDGWFDSREKVRRIAEGLAFKPSFFTRRTLMGSPAEITQDRFVCAWPTMSQKYTKV